MSTVSYCLCGLLQQTRSSRAGGGSVSYSRVTPGHKDSHDISVGSGSDSDSDQDYLEEDSQFLIIDKM